MIYIVSYTLRPKRDATKIINALKASGGWAHYLDETWLISTQESAQELYNRLVPAFQKADSILIVAFKPDANYQGWLPQDAWDWVKQNLR